jgi:hypothetical protein
MSKDRTYLALLQACAEPGCPLCRMSLRAVRSHLDSIMYEYVNDPGMRSALIDARGYCNEHASWLAEGRGRELGVAIVYRDVVANVHDVLQSTPPDMRRYARELLERLRPAAECPACVYRRETEDRMLGVLLVHLDREELRAALDGFAGLCLPHFERGLELGQKSPALGRLVSYQVRALARLRDELAEFIRKNDYRFANEGFGDEGDSWLRALAAVSGQHGGR